MNFTPLCKSTLAGLERSNQGFLAYCFLHSIKYCLLHCINNVLHSVALQCKEEGGGGSQVGYNYREGELNASKVPRMEDTFSRLGFFISAPE